MNTKAVFKNRGLFWTSGCKSFDLIGFSQNPGYKCTRCTYAKDDPEKTFEFSLHSLILKRNGKIHQMKAFFRSTFLDFSCMISFDISLESNL